jgi:hypothetical protein
LYLHLVVDLGGNTVTNHPFRPGDMDFKKPPTRFCIDFGSADISADKAPQSGSMSSFML